MNSWVDCEKTQEKITTSLSVGLRPGVPPS